MAQEINTNDLHARIKAQLGERYAGSILQDAPEVTSSAEEIHASEFFTHLANKDAYLAWVADYKSLIKEIEVHIKALKAETKVSDIWVQASAQSRLSDDRYNRHI